MTAELFNTDVNMDGLLEVLGKNLYSSPNVAIRELVQNAHDACVRREIEETGEHSFRIQLIPDYTKKTLKKLVSNYFDGSMSNLVSFLVKQENVDVDELSDLIEKLKD